MSERLAVIDLGTNTFHLLIVETGDDDNLWTELYRERHFVQLAQDGIEKIGPESFERGIQSLSSYAAKCIEFKVNKAKAFGTAALRRASNSMEFIKEAQLRFPFPIEIIDGKSEAELITQGVELALPTQNQEQLIMDIGGGSVEFILYKNSQVLWAQSFPVGVAILHNEFHHSDPIASLEIEKIKQFLAEKLTPLESILKLEKNLDLVGASGTFDVLEEMMNKLAEGENYSSLDLSDYSAFHKMMIESNLNQRKEMEKLPKERSKLIIVALILIDYILSIHPFKNLLVSRFAMKEGMLKVMKNS